MSGTMTGARIVRLTRSWALEGEPTNVILSNEDVLS